MKLLKRLERDSKIFVHTYLTLTVKIKIDCIWHHPNDFKFALKHCEYWEAWGFGFYCDPIAYSALKVGSQWINRIY